MRKRILWISLAITLLGILFFSIASAEIYYTNSVKHSEQYLKTYMNFYDSESYSFDTEGAKQFSIELRGARVTFMKTDGTVVADSEDADVTSRADRPEVKDAIEKGEGFSVRSSSTLKKDMAYYCVKTGSGESAVLVRIAIATSSEWSIFTSSMPTLVWFILLDVILCLLFTYIATVVMMKPIEDLTRNAALRQHVETKYPELKPIAEEMNKLNDDAEAQLSALNAEKELVVKAQNYKNEFIANVTHEMNTPLTSIKGFAELLKNDKLPKPQKEKALDVILGQSERLTNLIASIINYNEIDNDELPSYDVDASKILNDLLESLKPSIDERHIILDAKIESGVIIQSRHERLNQIFGNLLRNAIKYNKDGGALTITLSGGEKPMFKVKDSGIGISEKDLGRIFDRFFTVDKSHGGKNGGFGLGLAVVKKLCVKANWQLDVKSKVGEGTEFTVNFKK